MTRTGPLITADGLIFIVAATDNLFCAMMSAPRNSKYNGITVDVRENELPERPEHFRWFCRYGQYQCLSSHVGHWYLDLLHYPALRGVSFFLSFTNERWKTIPRTLPSSMKPDSKR